MTVLAKPPIAPASPHNGAAPAGDFVTRLLAEQRDLTAVERFARVHEADSPPAQAKYYRDLIPLTTPGAGEQYAFEVDLDACTGCKACVSACHSMNGLEPTETWRAVGLLQGTDDQFPILQHVTTACHHCLEPACLAGCPTNAYEKDPITGVVSHLDDQCFGCQYCTMACPYEVPQYSKTKGIVRKCDMCHGRLAAGEAPACVQACPSQAIRIRITPRELTKAEASGRGLLPGAPDSEFTKPTTRYLGADRLPAGTAPADAAHASPQHAHWPLIIMLTLIQMGVGAFAVLSPLRWWAGGGEAFVALAALTAMGATGVALAASTLHLGRPTYAFRAVLGWRHSWLSREAIAFGAFAGPASAVTAYALLPYLPFQPPLEPPQALRVPLEAFTPIAGAVGVYCSIRIYQFTRRVFWIGLGTASRFWLTSAVLGPALVLACWSLTQNAGAVSHGLAAWIILAATTKLLFEASILRPSAETHPSQRLTGQLMTGPLAAVTGARFAAGVLGGVVLPLAGLAAGGAVAAAISCTSLGLLVVGELAERTLFFGAVIPLRMPGGIKP
ncbi:Anaerobic dimethyl sulfoxide reductase chain B [Pirellulimonas nuda]|uniref:Anaerobic dimethyl sulfoxide reductase chain B n=1 Tax=Pirellulimonas nuda TaxID=2528009 RepID=A0A518DG41_9BACT|nr:DmsC/YnfH family molybdoenzyme membrane anchor subunit [Pirellulimonas nuda]QDU90453.1 Anaerobic dimethyl sulfoxide reductase chain B [Pirellulimonas nuda]